MKGPLPIVVRHRRLLVGVLVCVLGAAVSGRAETVKIATNPDYEASGNHQFWFGKGYRGLWTTPVELEVLDLEKEAGGLTVVRRVGGMQTPGLALKGADGRSYTFRWIDKDPSRLLPEEWTDEDPTTMLREDPEWAVRDFFGEW